MSTKIRWAQPNDVAAMSRLWQAVFKDQENYIHNFFDTVFTVSKGVVYDENGVKGMLFLVPYTIIHQQKEHLIHYVYAVAVDETARNKGVMRQMLDFAYQYSIQNNFIGHILIPATPSLFQLYQNNGFVDFSTQYKYDFEQLDTLLRVPISIDEYFEKRRDYLTRNGSVIPHKNVFYFSLLELSEIECYVLEDSNGETSICLIENKKIRELLGFPSVLIEEKKYTMIKTPNSIKFEAPYFNFGMD